MTELTPFVSSYESTPLSSTVNSKTGTKIERFQTEYDESPNLKGTIKRITLGENTPLKELGVDTIEIHKVPGQNGELTFSKSVIPGDNFHWEGATFKIGEKSMIKKFLNVLRELPKERFEFYKDITNRCMQYALDCEYITIDNKLTVHVITQEQLYTDPVLSDSLKLSSCLYKVFTQNIINTYYSFGIKKL